MAERREECPAKIVGPNYEETTIAQKPSVAKDKEERNSLTEQQKQQESGGKRTIQRLNEESGHQENVVLSTWRWCKQGWLHLSQTTDCWSSPRSS